MTRTGLTLSPSPLRVLDRALVALRQDIGRLLLAITLFFLLPYLAGYFIVYKPLIDGSRDFSQGFSTEYLVRYYSFTASYFVLHALSFCIAGRLIHDRLRGVGTTFLQAVREGPWLWLRGLLPYLLLSGLTYLGQSLVAPAILIAFISTFLLPPFMLERQGFIRAVRTGWSLCRGRFVITLLDVALIITLSYGAQWLIGWINGHFAGILSFTTASIVLNVMHAIVHLFITACMLSLYACCRELARPPGEVAELFE